MASYSSAAGAPDPTLRRRVEVLVVVVVVFAIEVFGFFLVNVGVFLLAAVLVVIRGPLTSSRLKNPTSQRYPARQCGSNSHILNVIQV
jgi:hypothetical protein